MNIRVEERHEPARWNDCSGTCAYAEYRVWIDGKLVLDTFYEGDYFEDREHAIDCAKYLLSTTDEAS